MNLYLLEQSVNDYYDTYDSCVVCAKDEESARIISPDKYRKWHDGKFWFQYADGSEREARRGSWCSPSDVKVKLIGVADASIQEGSVVCSSYNAG